MTFSTTTFTAPSGLFVSTTGYQYGETVSGAFLPIYNPGVLPRYAGSYETKKSFEFGSDEWSAAVRKYSTPVTAEDFDSYGGKLVELTSHILSFEPHCSLGPLRGAAKPCVTAEVMSRGECAYEFFNFQENSNRDTHPRIIKDLTEILLRRDPGQEIYRINVTDTSRGGQGINNLVQLMTELKSTVPEFKHQRWQLDLNLLHDTSKNTNLYNIEGVRGFGREGSFDLQLNRYVVPSLIVEDFDPALAFKMERDGERHIFKPCAVPGDFLYQVGSEIRLIHSENCYLTFEELYSRSITEFLTTDPEREQVGVVWNEFQQK
jgi:hypothetical protein